MFMPWPKIPRWESEVIITEKIDGTNAQIHIVPDDMEVTAMVSFSMKASKIDNHFVLAGSRNRYISPHNDNFGFAQWVYDNHEELYQTLGPGRHFGEWWGKGIQRGYGLDHKKFSLFNVHKWSSLRTPLLQTVPIITTLDEDEYSDLFESILDARDYLTRYGSFAVSGYMKPEGMMVFHSRSNQLFKIVMDK